MSNVLPPHPLLLALLLAAVCPAARGQSDPDLALAYGDREMVSIATGGATPIAKAPSVASVITAEDIKAMGATDLDQVLETVPGLHVSRHGNQWLPLYGVRGILTQFNPEVLVMVNGIPITSGYVGDRGRQWGDFPLENVARIEVIRGPGSALHGAEAVSGVINIVTQAPGEAEGDEFGLRAGSFDTYHAWVRHGGRWADFDTGLYLRLGRTDGFAGTVTADAQSSLDTTFSTAASHAPGPVNAAFDAIDVQLDLSRKAWRLRSGYKARPGNTTGSGVADALDPDSAMDGKTFNTDLTWQDADFRPDWAVMAQAAFQHISEPNSDITLFPAGSALPLALPGGSASSIGMVGRPQHWERHTRLEGSATYTGLADHKLRLGAGWFRDDLYKVTETKNFAFVNVPGIGNVPMCVNLACSIVEATQANGLLFLAPHLRDAWHAYVQDEWSLAPDWTFTAGVRHDHYSDFGGTTNPRLALVWDTAYNLTSKLMLGRAFRAPSFVELYTLNNPVALGNPDLKPETIDSLELAFAWQPRPRLKTGLNLFHYRLDDVIRFLPNADPTTGSTAGNAGRQHGSGLELEVAWEVSDSLRLSGNYAYQRSIDEATDQDAGLAPHHQVYLRADWRPAPGWLLNGQAKWVLDREREPGDSRPPIDDYVSVDLTLRRDKPGRGWEPAISLRNLFDADVREPTSGASASNLPDDLPMPGRSVWLELRYRSE